MPRTTWFKKLWDWKKNKKSKDKGNLYRTRRMKSFKIKKQCNVKIKAYDLNGKDISQYVRSSFVYNGVPGGFYLDTTKMREDGY